MATPSTTPVTAKPRPAWRSRSRRMTPMPMRPRTAAAMVPTTVKAPTMARMKLARAKLLVRTTGRRVAGALSMVWHSGQLTI